MELRIDPSRAAMAKTGILVDVAGELHDIAELEAQSLDAWIDAHPERAPAALRALLGHVATFVDPGA